MAVANKTSRYCWAYETVPGTAEIVDATTVTYFFGEYNQETGDWNAPFAENKTDPYWVYANRTPLLTDLDRTFPTFGHTFLPTSCQPYAWILKYPATATPMTIVALETGLTSPLTIRLEESGGTLPTGTQAVGCYCVGLNSKAERGSELMVESVWAWQELQDVGAAHDEPTLTTAPVMPAGGTNGVSGTYEGNPEVKWDIGGDNNSLTEVFRADWNQEQDYGTVSTGSGATQTVYTYKYKPVEIILYATFETDDYWDDYIDRKVSTNMTIKLWKHDRTHYILATFTNCRVINWKKTGHRFQGHFGSMCAMVAEKVTYTSNWLAEYDGADGDFGTHFKAGV